MKSIVGEVIGQDTRKLANTIEKLTTENALLVAETEGLRGESFAMKRIVENVESLCLMIWVLIMMLKGYSLALTQFKGRGTVRIYSKAQLVVDA